MREPKNIDFYEMVKPKNKIRLFKTYLYSLSLTIFQPIYIPILLIGFNNYLLI
jgi:hypothetical protein